MFRGDATAASAFADVSLSAANGLILEWRSSPARRGRIDDLPMSPVLFG